MSHEDELIAKDALELCDALLNLRLARRRVKDQSRQGMPKKQRLTKQERKQILAKTDGRCHICGGNIDRKWNADHVMARSGGGKHTVDNYLPAHSLCNNYRWDYLPEEFQLVMKIGIWCRKQIEERTTLGVAIAGGFLNHEKRRLKRRETPRPA